MNYTVMAPETYRLDKAKLIHSTVGCGSISNRAVGSATLGLYIPSFPGALHDCRLGHCLHLLTVFLLIVYKFLMKIYLFVRIYASL
jgi:hypothetical protein